VISISFLNTTGNDYLLVVADNGIGMPQNLNDGKRGSLGMSLMKGLSEDLDGNFSIENNNGTEIKIWFVCEPRTLNRDRLTASFPLNN
jgi:two-component sensor histidine kinase